MKIITSLFIGFLFCMQSLVAQKTIHNYAYVVVPEQFYFQDAPGQYQLNELVKFLFKKEGMTVFYDSEKIPQEMKMIDCGGLKMKLNKESSMFKVKVSFSLTNCENDVVFKSEQGTSREKDYQKAYHESIRNAFKGFTDLKYAYVPTVSSVAIAQPISQKEIVVPASKLIFTNEAKLALALSTSKNGFIGKVVKSPTETYVAGELICKLIKTSLPNVFKVQWKDTHGDFKHSIGYFDETGNLKIDFYGENGVTVTTFFK